MRKPAVAALAALALIPVAACNGPTTTDTVSYQIDEAVTALVLDGRAAAVHVESGDGPATVTETYRWSGDKPRTSHTVANGQLRLTESGCGDDNARCEVRYRVRVPRTTSTEVTVQAGALELTGLGGPVNVRTEAGAVEATGLTSDEVTVATTAGAVKLSFTEAPTLVRTSSELGAVELGVPRGTPYALDVHTDTGKATISVDNDPASKHRIEIRNGVGTVRIEHLL